MSIYIIILNQVTIYIGTPLFVIGVVGNLINACAFYKNNLQNPSTFLLFLVSCSNILYMHIGLLVRVLGTGFNVDLTFESVSWCKIRYALMQICVLLSLSCVCYATLDQCFVSSNQEKWRRLSRISLTRKVALILIIVSILSSIPFLIFTNLVHRSDVKTICTVFAGNDNFIKYIAYFNLPIIWTIAPICFLAIFGALAYRNVSLLRVNRNRARAQRHLTSMILLHIIFIILGTIPLAFYYGYLGITLSGIKSPDRQALESLVENLVTLISFFTYSSAFFVYYFSSKTHRDQVKELLHMHRRRVQVAPRVDLT